MCKQKKHSQCGRLAPEHQCGFNSHTRCIQILKPLWCGFRHHMCSFPIMPHVWPYLNCTKMGPEFSTALTRAPPWQKWLYSWEFFTKKIVKIHTKHCNFSIKLLPCRMTWNSISFSNVQKRISKQMQKMWNRLTVGSHRKTPTRTKISRG